MPQKKRRTTKGGEKAPVKKQFALTNIELVMIATFCVAIFLYGISKCTETEIEENIIVSEKTKGPKTEPKTEGQVKASTASTQVTEQPKEEIKAQVVEQKEPQRSLVKTDSLKVIGSLYVKIDNFKLRSSPSRTGKIIGKLKLGEEVNDLGVRGKMEEITLKIGEITKAPWVKVQTKKGLVGWTYGGGLQFYPLTTK